MFLIKVCRVFKKHNINYAVVGGHAVNLHGFVRGTIDIDFITNLTLESLSSCEKALNEIGLVSNHPISAKDVFNFREEYIKKRNMIAWNFYNPTDPSEQIDIIITLGLKKQEVINKRIRGFDVKVLGKKDLIKMKKKSGRKQDLIDIEALELL